MIELQAMYGVVNNSPRTKLVGGIAANDTVIPLADANVMPPAPNIATIGEEEDAELVLYNGINGNALTGCIRGYNGTLAQVWQANEPVYRGYTSVDHDRFVANIKGLHTAMAGLMESLGDLPIDGGPFVT